MQDRDSMSLIWVKYRTLHDHDVVVPQLRSVLDFRFSTHLACTPLTWSQHATLEIVSDQKSIASPSSSNKPRKDLDSVCYRSSGQQYEKLQSSNVFISEGGSPQRLKCCKHVTRNPGSSYSKSWMQCS